MSASQRLRTPQQPPPPTLLTNELCVGSTCVTPTQFAAMVAAASQAGAPSEQGSGSSAPEATSTRDTPPATQINGDNPATMAITLNPNYASPANQTLADGTVGSFGGPNMRWVLGGTLYAPVETDNNGATIRMINTGQDWIDGTTVEPASTNTLILGDTSILHYRNINLSGATIQSGDTGTLVSY